MGLQLTDALLAHGSELDVAPELDQPCAARWQRAGMVEGVQHLRLEEEADPLCNREIMGDGTFDDVALRSKISYATCAPSSRSTAAIAPRANQSCFSGQVQEACADRGMTESFRLLP